MASAVLGLGRVGYTQDSLQDSLVSYRPVRRTPTVTVALFFFVFVGITMLYNMVGDVCHMRNTISQFCRDDEFSRPLEAISRKNFL
ncbi:hypothetical protein X801_08330, partial [Opisthorchis viverrini]